MDDMDRRVTEAARRLRDELGREQALRIARYRGRKWIESSHHVRPEIQECYRVKGAAWWRAAVRLQQERPGERLRDTEQ